MAFTVTRPCYIPAWLGENDTDILRSALSSGLEFKILSPLKLPEEYSTIYCAGLACRNFARADLS